MAKENKKEKKPAAKKAPKKNAVQPSIFEEPPINYGKGETEIGMVKSDKKNLTKDKKIASEYLFDWSKPIYMQLHKGNLYNIFSSALITQSKYVKNRAFTDNQSIDENMLVFSNGYLGELNDSQILCEIIIPEKERINFVVNQALAFSFVPIPVSRIRKIYATSEIVKKDIIVTALTADGGIIPEKMIETGMPKNLKQFTYERLQYANNINDHSYKIRKFDRILGSFAFLKNYSWLMVNKTDLFSILPLHLYYMANAVSEMPDFLKNQNEKATSFYKQLFGLKNEIDKPFLRWIFNRLTIDENFTDTDIKDFGVEFLSHQNDPQFSHISKNLLNDLTDSLKRRRAIHEIWELQEPDKFYLYLFAFLRSYGNSNSEDKSTSRIDIPEIVSPSIGEYVFAILGFFYGYKLLRNFEEKLNLEDPFIRELVDVAKPIPIKFELTSTFDYAIIESVYESVFKDNTQLKNVEYLGLNNKSELIRKPSSIPANYSFSHEVTLGKFNFTIKKKSVLDDIYEKLNQLPDLIPIISDLGIYLFRNDVAKSTINFFDLVSSPNQWKYIVSFRKESILEALKNKKIDSNELLARISIGQKHQEY